MNAVFASLMVLTMSGDGGEDPPQYPIAEFSPQTAMTYSLSPTLVTVQSNQLFQIVGTITDMDTYVVSGNPATYQSVPSTAHRWNILLDSGSLVQLNDANGNPVPNPSIANLGAGSLKTTYTIRAKGVSVQSVYVDTYTPEDYGGLFRPPAVQHIWDGSGNVQTVYVTVNPAP